MLAMYGTELTSSSRILLRFFNGKNRVFFLDDGVDDRGHEVFNFSRSEQAFERILSIGLFGGIEVMCCDLESWT
jgi:hypothetical protein